MVGAAFISRKLRPRRRYLLWLLLLLLMSTGMLLLFIAFCHDLSLPRQPFYLLDFLPNSSASLQLARALGNALSSSRHTATSNQSMVQSYKVEEFGRWYHGSSCSGRSRQFAGDSPFFPPCRPDLPSGIATWGRYPYMEPKPFLLNSKNPCWEEKGKGEGRVMCLPYFFQIGVSKSGTTDLFARLTSHPRVIKAYWKESHFFDRRRYQKKRTLEAYIREFNNVAKVVTENLKLRGYSNVICGDGTPSYFYDNLNWTMYSGNERCSEPRVISAHHIYHLNPLVRVVLIVRHPVSRLYSRYLYDYGRPPLLNKSDPPSPKQFHGYVADGLRKCRDCFQRWSLRHCVYNNTLADSMASIRIQENLYPVLLEDWLRVIPRDQFLVVRFEDYQRNMTAVLGRVFQFLGLESHPDILAPIASGSIRNQGRWRQKTAPMLQETRRLLEEFHRPFIERLAAMLNDKRFLWEDVGY